MTLGFTTCVVSVTDSLLGLVSPAKAYDIIVVWTISVPIGVESSTFRLTANS